ncbi:MAG: S9 family peptidase [Chloroflexi bacterium]|nr:S9 family peptidase [Chloroflexota bacterium]
MGYSIERFLHISDASSPAFSPDGRWVAYLDDITGTPQLWRAPAVGGEPEQLTFFTERVRQPRYAPKGLSLVLSMDRHGDERQQLHLLDGQGATTPLTASPNVIHNFGAWSPDGKAIAYASNARDEQFFDPHILDLESRTDRLLFLGEGTYAVAGWSPDGGSLLLSQATDNLYNLLYLYDLKSGALRLLTPAQDHAAYASAAWAAEGRSLYLLSDEGREFKGVASLDIRTRKLTYLPTAEWDADLLAYSPATGRIACTLNVDGYSELLLHGPARGGPVPLDGLPRGVVLDLRWSPDGQSLAATVTTPRQPPSVWLLALSGGVARPLSVTSFAGLRPEAFVEPKLVRFPSFDGRAVPAWLYLPPSATGPKGLPMVVEVHGGPEGQARPAFDPVFQYLLHRGYGIFSINYRGSSGYGRSYVHLDDVEKRLDTVKDMAAACDWLVESGYTVPQRIAAYGGSYGGFMVLALAALYPDRCCAGVSLYGISNFQTYFETTGVWRRKERAAEYGDPVKDAALLRSISPVHSLDRVRVPLLLLHGAADPIVTIGESEQVVEACRALGHPVEYVRIEDEGHGFVKRHNRVRAYRAVVDFLEEHLPVG